VRMVSPLYTKQKFRSLESDMLELDRTVFFLSDEEPEQLKKC
jgi:hypothetical protein